MARPARADYGDAVMSALRSFLAEPRDANAPGPLWRDWVLVAALLIAGLLEATLREDLRWPVVVLIAGVAPALCLPWRRTHPIFTTGLAFGAIIVGDAVSLAGTGEPIEPYVAAYVLLLPYALFRWGSGVEAVAGMAIVLAAHGLLSALSGNFGDLVIGPPFLCLPAALGASIRYRASSRLRERRSGQAARARAAGARAARHGRPPRLGDRHPGPGRPRARRRRRPGRRRRRARGDRGRRRRARSPRCARWSARCATARRPDLAPQRGVADIERLAQPPATAARRRRARPATSTGCGRSVGAAIYRLAQESITNAVRHARHATRIDVRVAANATACA